MWKILLIKCRIFIISFSSVISERLSRRKDYLTFCSRLTFSGSPQICSYLCFCRGFHSCATEGPLIARGISTSLSPSRFRGFGGALRHTHTQTKAHHHVQSHVYKHKHTHKHTQANKQNCKKNWSSGKAIGSWSPTFGHKPNICKIKVWNIYC